MLEIKTEINRIQEEYGDVNLIDMVHQYMNKDRQKKNQERVAQGRTGKFYPSSVGRCKRQIAYQMLGYPGKEIPGQNLLIMENGTYFHERMEQIFEDMGIMIAPELKLKHDELRISGRSDAIIWNFLKKAPVENDRQITLTNTEDEVVYSGGASDVLLVEFKSIKSTGYDRLPKTKAKKEHIMQLQLYMYLTGIHQGLVYYENKDTQQQKYFYCEYDQAIVDKVIADIKFVISYIDEGKLPPREFQPVSFDCRFCDFRDICHPPRSNASLDDIF